MNEILKFLELEGGRGVALTLWELMFALGMSLVCSLIIGLVYRYTHHSAGYSQSFVQTLVVTSMVTALIMIVIGSNLARAFSLVGALSIIRFRNAVKETRDVGYIFTAMAVAMACGTRFYAVALIATGFICTVIILMDMLDYASPRTAPEALLRVQLPPDVDPLQVLEPVLKELFESYSFIMLETVKQGLAVEAVFSVKNASIPAGEVLSKLKEVNEGLKVVYRFGLHSDSL
jgi:hypothetical protein